MARVYCLVHLRSQNLALQAAISMILDSIQFLNGRHIVLASASPRRAQLLAQIGLTNIDIVPSGFEEDLDQRAYGGPKGYARETAKCKALDVCSTLKKKSVRPDLIISADTVVEIDGLVLEKPADAADAIKMIQRLSGRQHQVHTGYTIIAPQIQGDPLISSASTTNVKFGELSLPEIEAYIATGEPFGKAGAYGAQGPAGAWIQRIEGCYFNVMGLPLHDLTSAIQQILSKHFSQSR